MLKSLSLRVFLRVVRTLLDLFFFSNMLLWRYPVRPYSQTKRTRESSKIFFHLGAKKVYLQGPTVDGVSSCNCLPHVADVGMGDFCFFVSVCSAACIMDIVHKTSITNSTFIIVKFNTCQFVSNQAALAGKALDIDWTSFLLVTGQQYAS